MAFRWLRRKEDYEEIKERILGRHDIERPSLEPLPQVNERFQSERFAPEIPRPEPRFREPLFREEPIRKEGFEREFRPQPEHFGEERIEERLKFIEEQLSTIRAQNDAINERLKNLERKLGYP